ncbi:MAG: nitronate monooxygenase [Gemmatimonadetes bacterium]|nr:nitronate monooxygenase [Gemmatimonadota bacterium]
MTTIEYPMPVIIQGGMGIGVSGWQLARAVSRRGQLGVVSGTAIDSLFVRRLQDGDPGGHVRRAMEHFPLPDVSAAALDAYLLPDGRAGAPYRALPMWRQIVSQAREQVTMLASFVEVYLAREGHEGMVGMNLLTKVQLPNLATLYGAMMAGVDCIIMGAGIPREIPAVLDAFAEGRPASMKFDVEGLERGESESITFDPARHWTGAVPALHRPLFFPVVAAHSLATMLARKSVGRIDGFIVEGPTAGGHNAPPRGATVMNDRGEPVYGERDTVDLDVMRSLGLPFWLAGGTGSAEGLQAALRAGAAGIQVGTLFAYADESGLASDLKHRVLQQVRSGGADVVTDPRASPTGFPFKVVGLDDTNSDDTLYAGRERVCDLGYLRNAYRREDGRIGYRCAAEPVDAFAKKGGSVDETDGRKCLCNGLMANIGHPQERDDGPERALITSGDDLLLMKDFLRTRESYTAGDVIDYLLGVHASDPVTGASVPAEAS